MVNLSNSIIVFDTSAICKMYDMTDKTKQTMVEILTYLKDTIWIPGHVMKEYLKNREKVIRNPIHEKYATPKYFSTTELKKGRILLDNLCKDDYYHPYISASLKAELFEKLEKAMRYLSDIDKVIEEEYKLRKAEIESLVEKDIILNNVSKLNQGKDFSFSQMMDICKEGELRYRNSIPPGYMDEKGKKGFQIYGDLIIWKQIIEFAIGQNTNILFILNDEKEDWWENAKKCILREELNNEFTSETGHQIKALPLHEFISLLEREYKDEKALPFFDGLEAVKEALEYAATSKSYNQRYVELKCSDCNHVQKEKIDDFFWDWDECGWSEEEMGTNTQYDCIEYFECQECGNEMEVKFQLNEYPVGIIEDLEIETKDCSIVNDVDFLTGMTLPFDKDSVETCLYCGCRTRHLIHDMCDECLQEFNYKVSHD